MQRAEPADVEVCLVAEDKLQRRSQPRRHDLRRRDMRVVAGSRPPLIVGFKVGKLLGLMIRAFQTQRAGHFGEVAVVGHADESRQEQLPDQDSGAEQQEDPVQPGGRRAVGAVGEIQSAVSQIGGLAMLGQERIAHVETFELPEIAVPGVKGAHAVLKEDGGELGVGHQVPTNHLVCGDALVSVQEAVLFRDSPDVGERQERGEVRWGVEDAMMRGSSGPAAHCAKKRLAARSCSLDRSEA